MAVQKISLRKKTTSFANGDILYPVTDYNYLINKPSTFTPTAHTHVKANITDFPTSMPASDVYAWAKQANKPTYNASEVGALGATAKAVDSDKLDGFDSLEVGERGSGSDFADGILVTTTIDATADSGASWTIEVKGKGYGQAPFHFIAEGYNYSATFINVAGYNYGASLPYIKVLKYSDGKLAFWWPRTGYWNSFSVKVTDTTQVGFRKNYATNITNSAEPSSTKKVQINLVRVIFEGDSRLSDARPASDVYSWAKQANKPSYVWSEIGSKPSVIIEGDSRLTNSRPASDVYSWAKASVKPTYNASEVGALGATAQAVDSAKLGGLLLHSARNNEANKVVRTDANGYANFGWINTISGNTTSTVTDVYVNTNDGYIRKKTLALFKTELGSMPASDVYAWAKASSKPTYNASEVGAMSTSHYANNLNYLNIPMGVALDDGLLYDDANNVLSVKRGTGTFTVIDAGNLSTLANGVGLAKLTDLDSYVPQSMTINGYPLNANISLYNQDILPNTPISKTSSFTLALVDKEDLVYVNSSSATTVTIPTNASVAFPVGTEVHILQYGSGGVNITPASGVTLYSDSNKRAINARYQVVTLKKLSTDTWVLFGALKS